MAKRILSLLVAAMLVMGLIPAAAFAKAEAPAAAETKYPAPSPKRYATVIESWGFETDAELDDWLVYDQDGDGNNWGITSNDAHSGNYSAISYSYYNGTALSPDNWLYTPEIDIPSGGATLSFWACNYMASYPDTFSVYYITEDDESHALAEDITLDGGNWQQLTYDLAPAAGQTVRVAVRHHDCTDMYAILVDDFTIEIDIPEGVIATADVSGIPVKLAAGAYAPDLTANIHVPDDAHYHIADMMLITDPDDDVIQNGEYLVEGTDYNFQFILEADEGYTFYENVKITANGGRLGTIPETGLIDDTHIFVNVDTMTAQVLPMYGWYFEDEEEVNTWTFVDADGDGYNWYWLAYGINQDTANMAYEGVGQLTSASYLSGALTPDNWAISPEFTVPDLNAELRFYANAQDPNYAEEHFMVYVGTSTDPDDFTPISDELTTNGEYTQYTYDLSAHAGETIRVAFRHYDTTDMFRMNLDMVEIWGENEPETPEPELITEVAINGIVPPVNGSTADAMIENYSVPSDANYTVAFIEVYCAGFQDPISLSTVLEPNGETDDYYLIIYFGANEGYAFDENFTASVNGGELGVNETWIYYNGDAVVKTENMTFEAAAQLITEVEINGFVVPEWGAAPFYGVTVPSDAHYTIQTNVWTLFDSPNSTNTDMVDGDVYDHPGPDFNYYQRFMLVPDEGYAFPLPEFNQPGAGSLGELTVLINGSDELVGFYMVDYDESSETYGCLYIASASFTVEEPAENVIDLIEIEGFTAPVWGARPDYDVSVPEGAHYSIVYTEWRFDWGDGIELLGVTDPFDSETFGYFQWFYIEAAEGWSFDPNAVVTVNGDASIIFGPANTINEETGYFECGTMYYYVTEPEPNYITSVELTGFTVPAWGEHPDFDISIPEDAHYTIDYVDWSWFGGGFGVMTADDVFDNTAATYTMYVQLIPEEGWVLADDAVFTINGETALVDPMGCGYQGGSYPYIYVNSVGFTVEEPPAELIAITEINVVGFVIPEAGMTGAEFMELLVPADANYHIDIISGYNNTTGNPLVNEDILEEGNAYIVGAMVVPNEGYYFAEDAVLLANGGTELLSTEFSGVSDSETAWVVMNEYTIPVTPSTIFIDTVYINGVETVIIAGENADDHLGTIVIPDGEPYTIEYTRWFDEDNINGFHGAFVAGGHYSVNICIDLPEGYAFAEDVTVYINGETSLVSEYVYNYGNVLNIYTIPFECEAPASILGDVDLDGDVDASDAILTVRYVMGLIDLTDEQLAQADVDGDGDYDLVDATLILRYAMGLIDHFPAEEIPKDN